MQGLQTGVPLSEWHGISADERVPLASRLKLSPVFLELKTRSELLFCSLPQLQRCSSKPELCSPPYFVRL